MELRTLVEAIAQRWLLIVITTVVSAAVAGGFTAAQPPLYTATAQGMVSVSNPQDRPPYALSSGAQYILDRMSSYAELGVTTTVLTPVVDELGLDETPLSLSGRVSSLSVVGKAVLNVSVTYNDPQGAAEIADSIIAQTSRAISTLEKGNVQMVRIGAAVPPSGPSNQKVLLNSAVAGVGGLVLGCVIAVCLQLLAGRRQRRTAGQGGWRGDG
ncbi:MAG: hypothetical protein K0U78_01550 [Actinomycetia bacterium]|nr:hypothetical protein [Actinomycetes bacterium]